MRDSDSNANEFKALWLPSERYMSKESNIQRFIASVNEEFDLNIKSYEDLYNWSIKNYGSFWAHWWTFGGFISSNAPSVIVTEHTNISDKPKWFVGVTLNFAENLLRFRDEQTAIIALSEGVDVPVRESYRELYKSSQVWARALRSVGVTKGSRVAGYLPNGFAAVHAMLGTATLGAVWCSASPDFGVKGVLDRLQQVKPEVLVSVEAVLYNGKLHEHISKVSSVAASLPSLRRVVVVPFVRCARDIDVSSIPNALLSADFLWSEDVSEVPFVQVDFDHPIFVMFSSGTTGAPKCIVHGVGGTLIQIAKEHQLHCDLKREDVFAYYTTTVHDLALVLQTVHDLALVLQTVHDLALVLQTVHDVVLVLQTGWMMWQWLVVGLYTGCTLLLYDGSPLLPSPAALFDLTDRFGITVLGTGAKWLSVLAGQGVMPITSHKLGSLRCILSTGSPLTDQAFHYVYNSIKQDILLGSISGGTDIISCFMGCCPLLPVYEGEIQCRMLGMGVQVWGVQGEQVWDEPGELVCTLPFPSMPTNFWGTDGEHKYHNAYFSKFPGVWCHGDYCIERKLTGGLVMLGRSDGTLNPCGVRFGSAEIYAIGKCSSISCTRFSSNHS
ncbi:AMP-dependent synthetase/ligase [Trinorchestia longiramus]|nr:AMP-dependent synthetase/ligase [Trinorchestia longiramus]